MWILNNYIHKTVSSRHLRGKVHRRSLPFHMYFILKFQHHTLLSYIKGHLSILGFHWLHKIKALNRKVLCGNFNEDAGEKNQILVCQVLKKVHLLAEEITVLSPGFVPFSMGNTEALKALGDWEKQQRQSDFTGPSSHQLPTFQTFLIAILSFFPQITVLYTKLDCLQMQEPLDIFFFIKSKSKPQFWCQRIPCGFGTAAFPGPEHDIYQVFSR